MVSLLILTLIPNLSVDLNFHNQTTVTARPQSTLLVPFAGSQPTLVVLVQFSDQSNKTSPSKISETLFRLNAYYAEDSYGLVSFKTTVNPAIAQWYTLPHPMAFYSASTASLDAQFVTDSLQQAYNDGVDFHRFKFAMIVHAGKDEAITRATTDIHSFTIPGYVFNPSPLVPYQISTSVVSESDPVGVYCHEAGHLLGLPDLYDLTQQVDPVNNFVGYWEIMALGEWNPNNGQPPAPGTFPSQHSSWSKIKLGWITNSSLRIVYPGNMSTIILQNLELPTSGVQAVKIPIGVNSDGSLTYYLVELRAKLGTFDQYLPIPSDYPGAALLVYMVNESIAPGHGSLVLENAHPGGDLSNAGFGPCDSPCVSNNTFWDKSSFVKIIVTNTTSTAYQIVVDRTSSPLLLLQIDTPFPGMVVSVDRANATSDQSGELRLPVHLGPHEVFVQTEAPVPLSGTSIQLGLSDLFAAWDDGSTSNPRWVSVDKDTVLTATYRVIVEPSLATAGTAGLILAVILAGVSINRTRRRENSAQPGAPSQRLESETGRRGNGFLLPRDNGPSGNTVNSNDKPNGS